MAITSANQLELLQTAEAVAREKMIDPDLVIQAMEDSLARAAKSRYGAEMDIRVSIDRKTEDAETYLRARGYSFPAAWASPAWRTRFPKPKGLPITLVIGRDGKVLLAEKGQMFDEDVQAMAGLLTA